VGGGDEGISADRNPKSEKGKKERRKGEEKEEKHFHFNPIQE